MEEFSVVIKTERDVTFKTIFAIALSVFCLYLWKIWTTEMRPPVFSININSTVSFLVTSFHFVVTLCQGNLMTSILEQDNS
jgi:hypothetical protein